MSAGQLNQLSFKRETVWGTPVVPDKSMPIAFDGGIQTDNDTQLLASVQAKLAKNYDALIGNRIHEGDISCDLFTDYPYFFLLSAMGAVNSAVKGGETIVYEHDFTEAEVKPSLTVEQVVGENVRRYAGVVAMNFNVSGKAGEACVMKSSLKGKSQSSATKITPVYTAPVRPFNFVDAKVKIGGTYYTNIETFEFDYTNNIEFLHTINNNDPQFRYVKGSEVTGKLEMYLDSATMTELNNYLSKTESEIILELTGDAIGVASNYLFTLTIPRAVFTTAETPIREDYNQLAIEFAGLYDSVTSKLVSAQVVNLLANYN